MARGKRSKRTRQDSPSSSDNTPISSSTPTTVQTNILPYLRRTENPHDITMNAANRKSQVNHNNTPEALIQDTHTNTQLLLKELKELRGEISSLKMEMHEIKQENVELKESLNKLEQYSRRQNIRVFGVKEDPKEANNETEEKIVALVKEKLEISLDKRDIEIAHRVGRRTSTNSRPIIVRLNNRRDTLAILKKKRLMKGTGIVIAEDLTALNAKRFKEIKNSGRFSNVWTRNGDIFAIDNNGKITHITETEITTRNDRTFIRTQNGRPTSNSPTPTP